METAVVTTKGQVVIPVGIRRKYGIKNGSKVAFIEQDGKLIIQSLDKEYFNNLAGSLGLKGMHLESLLAEKTHTPAFGHPSREGN